MHFVHKRYLVNPVLHYPYQGDSTDGFATPGYDLVHPIPRYARVIRERKLIRMADGRDVNTSVTVIFDETVPVVEQDRFVPLVGSELMSVARITEGRDGRGRLSHSRVFLFG